MQQLLDTFASGRQPMDRRRVGDDAIASMVPRPRPGVSDANFDAALESARVDWMAPEVLEGLIARWTLLAKRSPRAIDNLIELIRTAPVVWQQRKGIEWITALVDSDYQAIAARSWLLPEWLKDIHPVPAGLPGHASLWQRMVDGLVAHGDTRLVDLQRTGE